MSEELHNRDNEISRLMRENQTNGSLIPEGQTGLEKHFNSQLEEHRRQNQSLRQQLQITQQKLEVSEKRETAENEPGPSKVELQVRQCQHPYAHCTQCYVLAAVEYDPARERVQSSVAGKVGR